MKIDIQIINISNKIIYCKDLLNGILNHFELKFLLSEKLDELTSKKQKLEEYRIKKAIPEFEKLSAECNFNIDKTVEKAKHYIGKEPVIITGDINRIVNEYQVEKDTITQEKRNEIYMRLVQHINFLTKKYKNK